MTEASRLIKSAWIDRQIADGDAEICPECFGENENCSACGGEGVLAWDGEPVGPSRIEKLLTMGRVE